MDNLEILAKKVYEHLKDKALTLATAESCTGGMIASYLTSVPGVSDYFGYGFVTYSNEAKQKLLGVSEATLKKYGAVSAETVCEMAEGAIAVSGADMAVSVSGIAGPGGGTDEKPVGLVYMGFARKGHKTLFEKLMFSGDRQDVRRKTAEHVFETVLNNIIINL